MRAGSAADGREVASDRGVVAAQEANKYAVVFFYPADFTAGCSMQVGAYGNAACVGG